MQEITELGACCALFMFPLTFGIGAVVIPSAVDLALRLKRAQIEGAFRRQLETYRKWAADPCSLSDAESRRIGRWAEDMARMEKAGKVEPSFAEAMADAGIIAEARPRSEYVCVPEQDWSFKGTTARIMACGALLAAMTACMVLPLQDDGIVKACATGTVAMLLALVVAVLTVCDVRAKVLPYQLCALSAVPSIALMLLAHDVGEYPACIASALAATVLLWLLSGLGRLLLGAQGAIGAGDLRLLPWVCLPLGPSGTVYGALACFALMFVWGVWTLARKRLADLAESGRLAHIRQNKAGWAMAVLASPLSGRKRRKEQLYLAMAPGLAAWLAVGFPCGLLLPSLWG